MTTQDHDVLARIADARRRRVEQMKRDHPAHVLRAGMAPVQAPGRLERALRRGAAADPLRMLCEIKRASPSKGMLNPNLDPVATALLYEAGGASAISVVTEPDFFHGDLAWVPAVKRAVTIPVLLKDFVVDSYQLVDAAARGADGVLLIAAMMSETVMQRFITEARLLGLDSLVEVHEASELFASLRAGATLVGINNRNLRTFEVDLETSLRLLPSIPAMVTAVAESGLSHPEHLERLRATRCDAVLMGEVFMTSPVPAATLATLAAAARG